MNDKIESADIIQQRARETIKQLRIDNFGKRKVPEFHQALVSVLGRHLPPTTYRGYEDSSRRMPIDIAIATARIHNVPLNKILGVSDLQDDVWIQDQDQALDRDIDYSIYTTPKAIDESGFKIKAKTLLMFKSDIQFSHTNIFLCKDNHGQTALHVFSSQGQITTARNNDKLAIVGQLAFIMESI
ncbi:hypothetical protein J7384_17910 [Endozoicomonas sp. G2_1]|uniref:hypothetical protein n=1 Tax=Endozoicomonas sp. G2_1 TaxID=2821091 RepID=UPI001ADD3F46|nr:hypothetical protein [Endozoicomonas sp. G2_1]MBO9492242.1 hypothetical protein [Endozoicomonas sp. G2_1]